MIIIFQKIFFCFLVISIIMFVLIGLLFLKIKIIDFLKVKNKHYIHRKKFYYLYRLIEVIEGILLCCIVFSIILLLCYALCYVFTYILSMVLFLCNNPLTDAQYDFILGTLIVVFCYPLSLLFIKFFTLRESKIIDKEKTSIAFKEYAIYYLRKIPIREIISICYVIMLFSSYILKLENDNGFDGNEYFMSFSIYLAMNSSADNLYKKYKAQFTKLDNRLFHTEKHKKTTKKLNLKDSLKDSKSDVYKFLLTGEIPKNPNKYNKYFS